MPSTLQFFDMSVQVQAPQGHNEPVPITLGPNRQPNDVRIAIVSGSASSGGAIQEQAMTPDPMTGFTAAYSLNPGQETHGVYYRRLQDSDNDNVTVSWPKPTQWAHFMLALLTVRGLSLITNPTAGWLTLSATSGDTSATANSVSAPGAGVMLLVVGTVGTPWATTAAPAGPVALGVPTGWANLVATDKSGATFYQYSSDPSLLVVGKSFAGAGSTGSVSFPTSQGTPAFAGFYIFLTTAQDVSATLSAA